MDQLAVFKKSQGVASKKNGVEKEISKTKTIVLYVNRNVKIAVKYVPTSLPDNPNPGYDVFGHWHQQVLYQGNVGGLSQCIHCKKIWEGEERLEVMVA